MVLKKNNRFSLFAFISLISLVLVACGSNDASRDTAGYDMASEDLAQMNEMQVVDNDMAAEEAGLDLGEKIIETVMVGYEALDFENTLDYVNQQIEAFEAQIEYSSRWQSSSSYGFLGERIALTLRVPQDSLHTFIETLNAYDDLVIQNQDFERVDVTKQYRDNETRIAILKEEETVLREMLQEQGSLEEILQIRTRLSELVTEREIFENQNQSYDDQIAYSTVHLEIQETDRANTQVTRGFWSRISNALIDSFYRFIVVGQNLVITFIYLIPYILVLTVVGIIILYIVRNRRKDKTL